MSNPKVSVVIPTYNRATFLPETLQSVFEQTFQDYEIIVVDDGSTDSTSDLLARSPYKERVKVFRQDNQGRSAARNTGVRHATGQYVTFLDSDDLFLPCKLEISIQFLDRHPDIDLVYGSAYAIREGQDGSFLAPEEFDSVGAFSTDSTELAWSLLNRNLFPVHTALVRKAALDTIPLFDNRLAGLEDWDLWLRFALTRKTMAYIDKPVAIYRLHGGNTWVVDRQAFVRDAVVIFGKVVEQDLDSWLPQRMRQEYRLQHLEQLLRTRSFSLLALALKGVVSPHGTVSAYGCAALARSLYALGVKGAAGTSRILHRRVQILKTKAASRPG